MKTWKDSLVWLTPLLITIFIALQAFSTTATADMRKELISENAAIRSDVTIIKVTVGKMSIQIENLTKEVDSLKKP